MADGVEEEDGGVEGHAHGGLLRGGLRGGGVGGRRQMGGVYDAFRSFRARWRRPEVACSLMVGAVWLEYLT